MVCYTKLNARLWRSTVYQQALTLIKQYPRIIIHRHHHPDGDAIGSQMGFYHLVRDNFPDKEVYIVGDAPGRYAFVPSAYSAS